jgi:hypothetical protein
MRVSTNPPLSNVQTELLKVFYADIPETHLLELKNIMARFLLEKAQDSADKIWQEKRYSDEKLRDILSKK